MKNEDDKDNEHFTKELKITLTPDQLQSVLGICHSFVESVKEMKEKDPDMCNDSTIEHFEALHEHFLGYWHDHCEGLKEERKVERMISDLTNN